LISPASDGETIADARTGGVGPVMLLTTARPLRRFLRVPAMLREVGRDALLKADSAVERRNDL
jgi:hypothetical protein